MNIELPMTRTEKALIASAQREAQAMLNEVHATICADRELAPESQPALDLVRGVITITLPDPPASPSETAP